MRAQRVNADIARKDAQHLIGNCQARYTLPTVGHDASCETNHERSAGIPLVSCATVADLVRRAQRAQSVEQEAIEDGVDEHEVKLLGPSLGGRCGVPRFHIIDCRYPYEYDGGHIAGAVNCYRADKILDQLLQTAAEAESSPSKRKPLILIFHCEFSSERAPKLAKLLRSRDRQHNAQRYPRLFFPEVYIMHEGYKSFYENHMVCEMLELHTFLTCAFF